MKSFKELMKENKGTQLSLDLKGGKAVHPAWKPFIEGKAGTGSRGLAGMLFKKLKGRKPTKNDIKDIWKSLGAKFVSKVAI